MDVISAGEVELLSFFEVEPSLAETEIPWCYNDASYHVEIGPAVVHFGIAPAYRDVSLSILYGGVELYKLLALSVRDVRHHNHPGGEVLEIVVTERESISLQLRPRLSISQHVASAP